MPDDPLVSVVLPVWRDEQALAESLRRIRRSPALEVIVACVLGDEPRYATHRQQEPDLRWVAAPRGRGIQMNAGAAIARGRWLLFLHADSVLPRGWLDVIEEADRQSAVVAGAFRLAIDSPAWQARLIERAVRLRVALFGMPYGDQALFVRRRVFERLGGYADLPLMEDVDLVRRLKRAGRMTHSPLPVLTSARRWVRDGWFRRSAQNLSLAAAFFLGMSPRRIARIYFRRPRAAVVMMGRAPWTGGKTRLAAADESAHADLRQALFLDTLDSVRSAHEAAHVVACEPADACERMRQLVGPEVDVIAQRGGDLGERLAYVFEDAFRLGYDAVVVVGSDLPDLPGRVLQDAAARLRRSAEQVVLGPARDGGYYLIGLRRPCESLFQQIDWSTSRVLEQTRTGAVACGLDVELLEEWADVDGPADLERLTTGATDGASRTRRWALERSGDRPA